jgi:hypothetical protein
MAVTLAQEEVANTIREYQPRMVSQILNHSPFLFSLKQKGNTTLTPGGITIGGEIRLTPNSNGKFYFGDEQWNTNREPTAVTVDYDWKQYGTTVAFTGREERINSGKEAKHNLVKGRIMTAQESMTNDIAASIFSDGTGSSGKEIGGLQFLVADDPTTGVVGGIDRSVETLWRNQVYDFSVESVTASADTIEDAMHELYLRCSFNNERPTLILAGSTFFRYYETAISNKTTINKPESKQLADAGFNVLEYKNIPVVYDSNCSATRMYMLNMNHMFFKVHPDANFKLDEKRISFNQDSSIFPIIWMGNLTMLKSKTQGVMIL